MRSEPSISQREINDLLSLMEDDEEMRDKLAKVLESELHGPRKRIRAVRDVGRLRR